MKAVTAGLAAGALIVTLSAQGAFLPARLRSGSVPTLPAVSMAVGGGEVFLELTVDAAGRVAAVTTLRSTASFTELTANAVRGWQFTPAEIPVAIAGAPPPPKVERVRSNVLVAAIFRPPTVYGPTLGEPIQDFARGSGRTPVPLSLVTPPLPPHAGGPGVVLVEVEVGATGAVMNARVLRSAPPFDQPALDAARRWKFRPARVDGRPVPSFVYVLFGFQTPTTSLPAPGVPVVR